MSRSKYGECVGVERMCRGGGGERMEEVSRREGVESVQQGRGNHANKEKLSVGAKYFLKLPKSHITCISRLQCE